MTQGEAARRLAAELHVNGDGTRSKNAPRQKTQKLTLSLTDLAEAKGLPIDFLRENGVEQAGDFVKFTYFTPDGKPSPRYRLRRALAGKNRFLWNKGAGEILPHGLWRLGDSRASGLIYFVEGETDALTLWLHSYPAIGLPGANTFRLIRSEYLEGISTVFIVCEPDRGGSTFLSKGIARLTELRICGSVRALKMPQDVKDPNELHMRWLGDPGAFESEWNELSRTAEAIDLTSSFHKDQDGAGSEERPPEFSDDQLALDFARAHADGLRHVAAWNQWFMWNGARWAEDKTLHTFDHVRRVCRRAAANLLANAENPEKVQRLASGIASAKTVAAVHSLGRADRRLAATDSQWDPDPMVLNTPGGTIDLRTGELRPHDREEYLTKSTVVTPLETPDCPKWLESLEQIFAGDTELIEYVQRAAGYTLTGLVSEQVLLFLFGSGGNGKNIVAETLAAMLGDYAVVAPMSLLLEQRHEQHPTELAVLRGARMALSSEVDPGRGWAEAKLKALTGGDRITARFMRGDFFEFIPQFKFWLRANHKPRLRTVDAAMRRRLHLVPFRVQFTGHQRDLHLSEKLRPEFPAILRWAIEGCLAWQTLGLMPPPSVNEATETYFADFDALDRWLDERCSQDANSQAFSRQLFASWRQWAEPNNERVGSEAEFVERLEARGFKRFRNSTGRGFLGICLRPQEWEPSQETHE